MAPNLDLSTRGCENVCLEVIDPARGEVVVEMEHGLVRQQRSE